LVCPDLKALGVNLPWGIRRAGIRNRINILSDAEARSAVNRP
jgi:hypothetical protein